jgi:hypothetical protein
MDDNAYRACCEGALKARDEAQLAVSEVVRALIPTSSVKPAVKRKLFPGFIRPEKKRFFYRLFC